MVKPKSTGMGSSRFRATVPKTALSGSEKQVEWANDIRAGQVNTIQAYYTSRGIELREKIADYESRGIRPRAVEKMRNELGSLADEAAKVTEALGRPTEAKWFIDHRGSEIDAIPTEQQLRENVANLRAGIKASYNKLKESLSDSDYLTGKYSKKSRRFPSR